MDLRNKTAVVFGGTSGIGRAAVEALSGRGARVWAVGRDPGRVASVGEVLGAPERAVSGDATDEGFVSSLLARTDPDLVIVALGVRPALAPVDQQTWASFSAAWETDVKATFHVGRAALARPLRPGSEVVVLSSGAALNGSPLSGGYAGAKRMQWFLTGYLRQRAEALGLGIGFRVLVPGQLVVGTEIGEAAAAAYGGAGGRDAFLARWPEPLTPELVAEAIVEVLAPERAGPLAHAVGGQGLRALP